MPLRHWKAFRGVVRELRASAEFSRIGSRGVAFGTDRSVASNDGCVCRRPICVFLACIDGTAGLSHSNRPVQAKAAGKDLVLVQIRIRANALFSILQRGLCHSRHRRHPASGTSGIAWMRALASKERARFLQPGPPPRHARHMDYNPAIAVSARCRCAAVRADVRKRPCRHAVVRNPDTRASLGATCPAGVDARPEDGLSPAARAAEA